MISDNTADALPVSAVTSIAADFSCEILISSSISSVFPVGEMTSQELASQENMEINKVSLNEVDANKEKLELLLEEKKVLNTLKSKLENENLVLKEKLINLENEILSNEKIINQQKDSLKQKKIDEKELEFLKLNLIYSDKCKKRAFNRLFEVGTPEYKKCILNKGKIN